MAFILLFCNNLPSLAVERHQRFPEGSENVACQVESSKAYAAGIGKSNPVLAVLLSTVAPQQSPPKTDFGGLGTV